MSQVVKAIYEKGVLRPVEPLNLQENEPVRVTVESLGSRPTEAEDPQGADPLQGVRASTGIPDLAEHFDDYRFGRRKP